jgi:hypothetical protein
MNTIPRKEERLFGFQHFWARFLILILVLLHLIVIIFTLYYDIRGTRTASPVSQSLTLLGENRQGTYLFSWQLYSPLRYNGVKFTINNDNNQTLQVLSLNKKPYIDNSLSTNALFTRKILSQNEETVLQLVVNPGSTIQIWHSMGDRLKRNFAMILGNLNYNYWRVYYPYAPRFTIASYQVGPGNNTVSPIQFVSSDTKKLPGFNYVSIDSSTVLYIVYYPVSSDQSLQVDNAYVTVSFTMTNYQILQSSTVNECSISTKQQVCDVSPNHYAMIRANTASLTTVQFAYQYQISVMKILSWSIAFWILLIIIDIILIGHKIMKSIFFSKRKSVDDQQPLNTQQENI